MARISGGEKMREVWVWPDISGREKARESWVEVWVWPDLSGGEKMREVWVGSGRVVSCRVVSCRVPHGSCLLRFRNFRHNNVSVSEITSGVYSVRSGISKSCGSIAVLQKATVAH